MNLQVGRLNSMSVPHAILITLYYATPACHWAHTCGDREDAICVSQACNTATYTYGRLFKIHRLGWSGDVWRHNRLGAHSDESGRGRLSTCTGIEQHHVSALVLLIEQHHVSAGFWTLFRYSLPKHTIFSGLEKMCWTVCLTIKPGSSTRMATIHIRSRTKRHLRKKVHNDGQSTCWP